MYSDITGERTGLMVESGLKPITLLSACVVAESFRSTFSHLHFIVQGIEPRALRKGGLALEAPLSQKICPIRDETSREHKRKQIQQNVNCRI